MCVPSKQGLYNTSWDSVIHHTHWDVHLDFVRKRLDKGNIMGPGGQDNCLQSLTKTEVLNSHKCYPKLE